VITHSLQQVSTFASIPDFAKHFRRSPDTLGPEHIPQYQVHLFHKKLSPYLPYLPRRSSRSTMAHAIESFSDLVPDHFQPVKLRIQQVLKI